MDSIGANPAPVIIGGPTAVGKSSAGVILAQRLNAEIVNIDSVQCYRDFNIGSAKIMPAEMEGVRHHLVGVIDPRVTINAAMYTRLVEDSIKDIATRGKKVVCIGGTTLYVRMLICGFDIEGDNSLKGRSKLEEKSLEELWRHLIKIDPMSQEIIGRKDRKRLIRAIEIYEEHGIRPSELSAWKERKFRLKPLIVCLCEDRERLYAKINERVEKMLKAGLIEEVREIVNRYGRSLHGLKSIGYKECIGYLEGAYASLEELKKEIAKNTRRLAKRQYTFWRNVPYKHGFVVEPSEGGLEVDKGLFCFELTIEELVQRVNRRIKHNLVKPEVWYVKLVK